MLRLLTPVWASLLLTLVPLTSVQEPDFQVDFSAKGRAISPTQIYGMNEHNTSDGAMRAWGERLQPAGGMMRIWRNYYAGSGFKQQLHAAELITKLGMDVLFIARGDPSDTGNASRDANMIVPEDGAAWAKLVAADVRRLQRAGARVRAIEIWDEPDMKHHVNCSLEEFAVFFAEAGLALRKEFPSGSPTIGGPAAASISGAGYKSIELCLAESAKIGFHPDFLSFHLYGGFATDLELYRTAEGLRKLAEKYGHPEPELDLSEWSLEMPPDERLDGPEAAAFFVGVTTAVIDTGINHSEFFFIEDGEWESAADFDGGSVGIFTLHGAPKAIFNGMQMVKMAAQYPQIPAKRVSGTPNLSLLATRQGNSGFILGANSIVGVHKSIRRMLNSQGTSLDFLKGKEGRLRKFFKGGLTPKQLGVPAGDEEIWLAAQEFVSTIKKESEDDSREVRVALHDFPTRIVEVRVVDQDHSNPRDDAAFRAAFLPFEAGPNQLAARNLIKRYQAEGVSTKQLTLLEEALKSKKVKVSGLSPEFSARVRADFQMETERIADTTPYKMSQHEAAYPAVVKSSDYARLADGHLILNMPKDTTVLVSLEWATSD